MYVLENYLQNIVGVCVEVSRGSKVPEIRYVQRYPPTPKIIFYNPKLLKNHNCFEKTVDPIYLSLNIG